MACLKNQRVKGRPRCLRSSLALEELLGSGGTDTSRSLCCPGEFVDAHAPLRQFGVPSVVSEIVRAAIRRSENRCMTRSDHLPGRGPKHAWGAALAACPRPHRVIGLRVVDAICLVPPAAPTVEAKVF